MAAQAAEETPPELQPEVGWGWGLLRAGGAFTSTVNHSVEQLPSSLVTDHFQSPKFRLQTSIMVGATAGLRLLPDGKADIILQEVRDWLRKRPFKVGGVGRRGVHKGARGPCYTCGGALPMGSTWGS